MQTNYVQGDKRRIDISDANSHHATIVIENQAVYELDFKLHEYTELKLSGYRTVPQAKPAGLPVATTKVNVYCETVDTGERKQFFGKTASHLILRERLVGEPGSCYASSTFEKEGWYFPVSPPSGRVLGAYILNGRGQNCVPSFTMHGAFPSVSPVIETFRPSKDAEFRSEIVELSDAPLDHTVFEIPPGFRKVDSFPQPQMPVEQVGWWESLKRKIWSWFS